MTGRIQCDRAPAGRSKRRNLMIPHAVIGKETWPEECNRTSGASLIVNVDGAEDGGYGCHDIAQFTVYANAMCTLYAELCQVNNESGLRKRLIAAALTLLETEGAEPSLRAVARAAGVSAMAPYRHFPDKAGLLAAVANHGFETLQNALIVADDQPDAREALFAQGMAFIEFARTNPALFRLMYSHHYGSADAHSIAGTYEILARRVTAILPTHAVAGTLACRSLVQGLATIALAHRLAPAKPEDIASAVRLFVAGLGARME